jgi:hypothetical protein
VERPQMSAQELIDTARALVAGDKGHGERIKLQYIVGNPLDLDKCTGL